MATKMSASYTIIFVVDHLKLMTDLQSIPSGYSYADDV
jgi:hypothetical protein